MTARNSGEPPIAALNAEPGKPTMSPFGPADEIGMLNLITPESRRRIMSEADTGRVFDLAIDYFNGMPSVAAYGDPAYQLWMDHTPRGTVIDDATRRGEEENSRVSYSGDSMMMYTHCGTHLDTLCHYGYHGTLWNGFTEAEHLGSRHWKVCGADRQPPIVARGVVLDIAGLHGVELLPDLYEITIADIEAAMKRQAVELRVGDVVLVYTGRMTIWPSMDFLSNEPGINLTSARYLAEKGAIILGSDNMGLEVLPPPDPDHWCPVHTYLLVEAGVPILEMADVRELVSEGVSEFAFVGAGLRLTGATATPIRPVAFPLRK